MDKNTRSSYNYYPKTKEELREILQIRLKKDKNADLTDINVSNITDMGLLKRTDIIHASPFKAMFGLFEDLDPHNINISNWDVSNVVNMQNMFCSCHNFNSNLKEWDINSLQNASGMFQNCESFVGEGLENWNTQNIERTKSMFHGCVNFNCNIGKWNVKKLTNASYMFTYCHSFEGIGIENWNVENLERAQSMFAGCELFNADISQWNFKKIKNISSILQGCKSFKHKLDNWNISEKCDVIFALKNVPFFRWFPFKNNIPAWYKNK